MNKELDLIATIFANEKGLSKDVIWRAIQSALEAAIRKAVGLDIGVRVDIVDIKAGAYKFFRFWDIVSDDDLESTTYQISLTDALKKDPDAKIGGRIEEELVGIEFGRIASQTAKQVIIQKVREAEREQIVDEFRPKLGQLIYGTVKKVIGNYIIIDMGGKAEAFMPRTELLPSEMFRVNDRVRAYLYEITPQIRGPLLLVSRAKNEMLIELFRIEVPEIGENIIEVKAAARDPGHRAKIAVKTNDGRIDPVGACVGMRGARVQAVSSELGGERVDIVLWDDNPAQFVINAMAPAEISSIVVDEDSHTMDLAVQKEHLSQAIGRNGQNVRLASQLTGWTLNVMTVEEFNAKSEQESTRLINSFVNDLQIEEDLASLLVANGFSSLEEIAYVPKEELLGIEAFDEQIVDELRSRANDALLAQALTSNRLNLVTSDELLAMEGMTQVIAEQLMYNGITTVDELAEQSVDDLMHISGMTEEIAGRLIMKAREKWFN